MAKSKASSKLLSKISSTQAEIKPKLVELASKYDQVLTDFDYVIGNWKGQGRLLRSDNEYVGAVKRAFKAISTGTECEDVEVHGHGTHLAHLPDPYKMLHTTFCGKQGKHFMDMLESLLC
ncbi:MULTISPECIES: hypothetical protein [unclassified Candidatus Tisiphia]|uniref:hypothetical protein n=1 Tax=unclassified Candidatus Tisiphia TaxID=2996318 RepID=UPI00312CA8D1